jgi:hypothetical protein
MNLVSAALIKTALSYSLDFIDIPKDFFWGWIPDIFNFLPL